LNDAPGRDTLRASFEYRFTELSRLFVGQTEINNQQMTLGQFVLSVTSSLSAIAVLYLLYLASAEYAKRFVATGEC
jgi:hypothetical protein